jgi:uncharacterized membrane protein (UPF0127 family)
LTETRVLVGDDCLRVAVADSDVERANGLRDRTDPSPYAGMLFVSPLDGAGSFTMVGVAEPLDIAWFRADGRRIGEAAMEPCDREAIIDCPAYRAEEPWRFALETPRGELPGGDLGGCA